MSLKKYMRKQAHFGKSVYLGDKRADDIVYALFEGEWRET
jgi:hypothetical protein